MSDEVEASLPIQVREKIAALMTAAFGLVAALAWNEAIKGVIAQVVPAGSGLAAQFVYALLVTLLAVLASVWIARSLARARKRAQAKAAAA